MTIYRITDDRLEPVKGTNFAAEKFRERQDLQRLQRKQIDVIAPDVLIISEEFGEFEGHRRRIDLLGIDRDANVVVVELKRTDDGGHMDLQAIRYAAMVSVMTFDKAVSVFQAYVDSIGEDGSAEEILLEHLNWEEPDEDAFCQDVRILLVSGEFSREITTAVLWLNDHGLDIRCIRLSPHKLGADLLLDIQQIIPLPEAEDFQVQLREKQQRERQARRSTMDLTKYDMHVGGKHYEALPKRWMVFHCFKYLVETGVEPAAVAEAVPWRKHRMFEVFEGELDSDEVIARMISKWPETRSPMYKRFFRKDDELFHVGGKTYALSNQWGRQTLEAIDCIAKAFPDAEIGYAPAK